MDSRNHIPYQPQVPIFGSHLQFKGGSRVDGVIKSDMDLDFQTLARYLLDDSGLQESGSAVSIPYNSDNVALPSIYQQDEMRPNYGFRHQYPVFSQHQYNIQQQQQQYSACTVNPYYFPPNYNITQRANLSSKPPGSDQISFGLPSQYSNISHINVQGQISSGATHQHGPLPYIEHEYERPFHQISSFNSSSPRFEGNVVQSESDDTLTAVKLKSQKSREQAERRKERNRVLARKTRLRKKFFYEALQEQVRDLRGQNERLKDILTDSVGIEEANKIFKTCIFTSQDLIAAEGEKSNIDLNKHDFRMMRLLQQAQQSFVVTDPKLPDNPIIFASRGFIELTGYTRDQVIGRNCRFLQGPGTDAKAIEQIRTGIREGKDTSICLLNYKMDGTPFYNQFFIAALRDGEDNIVNFVGVQTPVASLPQSLNSQSSLKLESFPNKKHAPDILNNSSKGQSKKVSFDSEG